MAEFLKGNFTVRRPVKASEDDHQPTLTDELESKLLAKLGGSVCYVKGKPFIALPKKSSDEPS